MGPILSLGYYPASSGNFLQTFRDNLSVPSPVWVLTQRVVVIFTEVSGQPIGSILSLGYYAASSSNFTDVSGQPIGPIISLGYYATRSSNFYRRFGTTYRSHPQPGLLRSE